MPCGLVDSCAASSSSDSSALEGGAAPLEGRPRARRRRRRGTPRPAIVATRPAATRRVERDQRDLMGGDLLGRPGGRVGPGVGSRPPNATRRGPFPVLGDRRAGWPTVNSSTWLLLSLFLAVAALDWVGRPPRLQGARVRAPSPAAWSFLIAAAAGHRPRPTTRPAWPWSSPSSSRRSATCSSCSRAASRTAPGPTCSSPGSPPSCCAHVAYVVGVRPRRRRASAASRSALVPAGAHRRRSSAGRSSPACEAATSPSWPTPVTAYIGGHLGDGAGRLRHRRRPGDRRCRCSSPAATRSSPSAASSAQRAWFPLAIIITYHLAQALLDVSFT